MTRLPWYGDCGQREDPKDEEEEATGMEALLISLGQSEAWPATFGCVIGRGKEVNDPGAEVRGRRSVTWGGGKDVSRPEG